MVPSCGESGRLLMPAYGADRAVRVDLEDASVDIRITGRHVEVPDDVRNYAQEKASKLPRFYNRIHEIELVLDHEGDQFTAEMIVRVDQKQTFVGSETGPDTFALIDLIVDKLERQLKKHKEKSRNHKHDTRPDFSQ